MKNFNSWLSGEGAHRQRGSLQRADFKSGNSNIPFAAILLLLFVSFTSASTVMAQTCNCTDYLYVNDPTLDITHKFIVSPTTGGVVGEVDAPNWLPPGDILNAHGVAGDINGNLYIAQLAETLPDGSTIPDRLYQVDCDGNILDNNFITPWGRTYNLLTIGNLLYTIGQPTGAGLDFRVTAYDVCTKNIVYQEMISPATTVNWGMSRGEDGNIYVTSSWGGAIPGFTYNHSVYRVSPDLQTITNVLTVPNSNADNFTLGVDSDEYGNVYFVVNETGNGNRTTLYKYSSNGTLIHSLVDPGLNMSGFGGAWGVTYYRTANKLYIGTLGDDCVAVIDAGGQNGNMAYQAALGVPHVPGTYSKAVNIVTECCPMPATQTITQTLCGDQYNIGDEIFLQSLTGCPGTVCGGTWAAGGANFGLDFDACAATFTISAASACGTFTLAASNDQCGAYSLTIEIEYNDIVNPTVSSDQAICVGDLAAPLMASATSGNGTAVTFQWQSSTTSCNDGFTNIPGATNATYNPGAVAQTTYYRVIANVDAGCGDGDCSELSNCVTITVNPLPTVNLDVPPSCCINDGVQSFGGGSPAGGTYSGPGVTDNGNGMTFSFDPAAAGAGTHTITYTFTDGNGCTNSATDTKEVFPTPVVTFTAPADLCIDAGVQAGLGGGAPTGGTYSGPGVTDDGNGMTYSFDPAAAGVGVHTITYTYTDGNTCTAAASDNIEVFALPVVTFTAPADLCIDAGVQAGLGGGAPTGGTYSGPGVTDDGNGMTYSFDPAAAGVGVHTITYTYTDGNSCTNATTDNVEVFPLPVVTFTAPADCCIDAGVQAGLSGGSPTGGVYSGPGVTDDGNGMTYSFDPAAAGTGTHIITYTFTDGNGCTNSASDSKEVFPLPVVTFTAPADLCIDAGVQAGLGGGAPTGGTYSGPGVTDDGNGMTYSFDPAAAGVGVHTITYTYTDGNTCTAAASDNIEVFPLPTVSLADPADECVTGSLMQFVGSPLPMGATSGSFTSTAAMGFTDNTDGTATLDPAVAGPGTYTITYTYTDANGCIASDMVEVEVYGLDFGDLEMPPYPTANVATAASHCVPQNPLIKLGATVDIEADGQPSMNADGDGADEDGFDPGAYMFVRYQPQDVTVSLMNMTGQMAKLSMFIDWDNNGDFTGPNEMYDVMVNAGDVSATLTGVTPPAGAVINQNLAVRFRLSTDMAAVMSPGGNAPDGEVEDYLITVMAFDYGDLADGAAGTGEQDYETLSANGGPSHKLITDPMGNIILKLGAVIDDELDGQQSADADGDGADEDSFDPNAQMFITGQPVDLTFPVMNMTGMDAKLTVYIDWNNDGDFADAEEMYFVTVADGDTEAVIAGIVPPLFATLNDDLGMRIRLTTDMAMSPNGPAPDGEVEDYEIMVMGFDYGDLADAGAGTGEQDYETDAANGGPSHKIITDENDMVLLKLGAAADDEADGQQSADADGEGADDDSFDPDAQMFITGQPVDLTFPVMNMTGMDAKLTVYIDWNNDGDFADAEEMYFVTVADGDTEAVIAGVVPPLFATLNDDLGMRIRLTTDMAMSPNGPAPDGEVEDYEIMVMGFDYGDLADAGAGTGEQDYETDVANGGPSHKIITDENDMVLLKLGAAADDEADGQQSADADGDDAEVADEDSFDPDAQMFITGQPVDLTFPVMNMTGMDAKLTVYIDWNNDGDFADAEEMYFVTVADGDTEAVIAGIVPPLFATLNDDLGMRIRLTTDMAMSPNGPAPDGEVEDYEIMVMGFDYGDLADAGAGTGEQDYETDAANGGPSHKIITDENDMVLLKLGAAADDEADGQQSADADGDGADDDSFDPNAQMFITGQPVDLTFPVMNMTGMDAKLTVYIDWNNDGDFGDAEEMYFVTVADGDTEAVIAGIVPPLFATLNDDLGMRIRLTTDMAMSPNGPAPDGEVEDYEIMVMGFDYGDLADAGAGTGEQDYETDAANGGPSHKIITDENDMVLLKLGAAADDEADGQQSADADGDDAEVADEDSFDPDAQMFITGQPVDLTFPVMNMTGMDAKLTVYIDWNNDGDFADAEEMYFVTVADGDTEAVIAGIVPPLFATLNDDLGMRIRLTTDMAMSPNGPAPDGEVEDYEIMVMGFDYGDLADAGAGTGEQDYETDAANGGPSHKIITDENDMVLLKLGAAADDEADGQQSADADGDDAEVADEDSFDPDAQMFITGQPVDLTFPVMNMTGMDAKLTVYIDWNNDGDFADAEEMYFVTVADGDTEAVIAGIVPPLFATLNDELGMRIRLTTDMAMSPTGPAPDGEVEDYEIMVMGFDYGDLADNGAGTGEQDYETDAANGGPSHKIITDENDMVLLKLGAAADDEADGQQSADADGDDAEVADEDSFDPDAQMFITGQPVDLTFPVMNMTGMDAKLTVYIDWNNDGDFADAEEMYFVTVADGDTEAVIAGIVPPLFATLNDDLGMRIRLTTDMAMSPNGPAPDGEVEDYEIMVMGFDYGDLADAGAGTGEQDYETDAANGGPSHKIITDENDMVLLKLGAAADDEADGQQSADADGEGADDDSFDPNAQMFITGEPVDLTFPVMNMTGMDAKLTVYIDWNNDGDFADAEEMYFVTVADGDTEAVIAGIVPPLFATLNDDLGMRIRLTTDMAMSPNGPAPDGEVEDYEIMVMGFDYGDLADAGAGTGEQDYETDAANGGPSHKIITDENDMVLLKLGAAADDEADGQQSADADGDDAEVADEDSFDPDAQMFITGQPVDLTFPVMNMTGMDAKLTVYIDWNNDGDFADAEEMYFVTVADGDTEAVIAGIVPPLFATLNDDLGMRIRLTTDMAMSPNGPAPDGEVEDYEIMVMGFDYGDLADNGAGTGEQDYETDAANGGPSHKIITDENDMVLLKLGAAADDEADGQQSADADGDDAEVADEDSFDPDAQMFITGQPVDLTFPVMNMTGMDAKLTVYIDWNNDGDFADAEEMYFVTVADGDTEAAIAGIVPPLFATLNDDLGMRIRLTTDMAMSPNGPAPDGEVEDYEIMVMGFDYGDLADAGAGTGEQDYETASANGGPSHKIITDENDMVLLKLGAAADDEADGQQSADADGDDAEVADEDSFDPDAQMFITGQPVDLTFPVMNMAGMDAKLTVYIDWNNDGDFGDAEEMYFVTVADGDTEAVIAGIVPPLFATLNDDLGMRIRLTTDMAMSPNGPAPDGEVEDYEIMVMGFDYGDLADAGAGTGEQDYETDAANGGPSHKIITDENDMVLLKLGAAADDEADGQQSADADGDDAEVADEDSFDPDAQMFITGQPVDLTFPVMNMTGMDAKLTVYIDWNNDGDFGDAEEMYFVTVADGDTEAVIAGIVPPLFATLNDDLGFRIRLTTDMAMSPTGPAPDGEVEDYLIMVMGFDYGDLPDVGAGLGEQEYETLTANGGPSHKIITNEDDMVLLKIGAAADDDADGQPGNEASNDDVDGEDDEDGIETNNLNFTTGQAQDIVIPVMNMTGELAKLTMFIDWNNDGDFDDDQEMYSVEVPDGAMEVTFEDVTPPLTATLNDDLGMRLRISTDMDAVMSPFGPAPDGEVEDHEVIIVFGFDYGDLPDNGAGTGGDPGDPMTPANYQTLASDDGAKHGIITNEDDQVILKIGDAADDESDGQPSLDAGLTGGDDNNAAPGTTDPDDEDGLDVDNLPFFILTQTTTLDIPVMNMTDENATLAAFIDYNKDGAFDPNTEKYTVNVPVNATSVSLDIGPIPADAVVGQDVGLRLRLANDMAEVMSATGCAASGEVEDYMVQIIGFDFGDLPDSYVTTGPLDAPRHIISEDLKLGACVDVELDGIPEAMAGMMEGGDDADPGLVTFGTCTDGSDEDGIEFTHPFIPGNESCITVTAMNMTGEDAVLQVWIDWNGDGMFGAGEELAFIDNIIPDGGVDGAEYCFPVPADVAYSQGSLFIRARLSPDGGLAPDEQLLPVPFGEIEDYKVKLSKVGSLVWEDYNGNGEQDEDSSYGLDGVTVELLWYGPDGDVNTTDDNRTYTVQTATVDGVPGVYSFCGLNPGTYSLSVPELPTDFVPTWSDIPGDDVIDSDDHAGVEFTIEDPMGLLEGEDSTGDNPGGINGFPDMQDDLSFDFGAYIPAELGDYVWLDESFNDADDTQESTGMVPDVPIEGVTITLMGTNNIGQPVMLVLVTDENGFYKFEDLAPGSYKVIFDASTALGECGPILLAVAPNVGDDALDSDQDPGTFTTGFYDLFSGDDIPTVDAGFVEPPFDFGCIADLNVTLGDNCSATITPDMILTGLYYCIDEFIISIDGVETDQVTGCGDHTYMIRLIEDGVEVYTCWGNIFAEDKTDPVVDCPDDVSEVTVEFALQTLEGSIDGTEEEITLGDYSCFQSFFEPAPDFVYNYDLITFTVDPDLPATDIYNIQTASNIPGLFITLFQGEFNEENPCENVLGGTEGAYFIDPFGVNAFFAQDYRIELALEPGQTYTLLVANTSFGTTGDYVVGIVSDNGGTFSAPFSAPAPVDVTLPLYCEDLSLVEITEPMSYLVNANGVIDQASISAELAAILDLTGYPEVSDDCGPVLVTVSDEVEPAGDCGDITITRTFVVSDRADGACVGTPRTAECTQVITLTLPTITDLIIPPYTATIECDEEFPTDGATGGPDDNPHASVTGYPFLLTASGYVDLNETYCNLGANYSDEPRIDVCEGTYKFRREWNLIDWCNPSDNTTWDQFVKVGDFTGPVISGVAEVINVSTSPFSCVANVAIPTPTVVDGNDCGSVIATTYTILAGGESFFAGGNILDGDVVDVPVGEHTLILCAEDNCGNETCEEYTLIIQDEIEPSAVCEDELNVSIGGGDIANGIEGIARIFAEDVDEGSYDNCSDVTLEVRRNYWRNGTCDASENRWSPWGEFVDFYCCDIANEITIELRVTDAGGNTNTCWMTVTPEDKLNPYCYAPQDVEMTCAEWPLAFAGDLEAAYEDDFAATSAMMSSIFGNATGTDNCAVDTIVERTPNIQLNECGWGSITRRFEAWQLKPEGDVNGNGAIDINEVFRSTNSCSQDIIVTEVHDFTIDFPEDAAADCGDADVPTVITSTDGCDVLSVNIGDPVVFSATGDECYKYSITYDVINWCLWDGEYEGYVIARMTEDDGESLPVDRAVEGNERPVVTYTSENGLCIDRRHNDRDGDSSLPNCESPTSIPNYGRYIYTQFVKIYDSTAPVVTVGEYGGPTANCPDLLPGQFGDDDGDCEEGVSIPFSVSDECELFDNDGNLVVSIVSAELDAFAVDANEDGDIKSNEFVADLDVADLITDNGDGTYSFDGTFPIITSAMGDNIYHAVRILFEDGCGNQVSEYIVFDVIDCKGPAPVCINGLTVTLMPQDDGSCAMAIWASDFEGSPISDCTGQGPEIFLGNPRVTKYAIYRAETVEADPNFVPSPDDTGLVLTQDDEETTVLYIYAFDEEGNYDYCETYVLVQAHVSCGEGTGTIAGVIMTEEAEAVEGVEVNLNGMMDNMMVTNTDGTYSFAGLPLGGDYSVTPYLNANPLNGVTTFDLIKISQHVLNVAPLDSPYKMIAADANRSGTITTLDMIQIRKLILNIITEFPSNTSWRFVDAAHAFTDMSNPWADAFPELINVNNLAVDILDADFVGVKIGDVNGSAQANALAGEDRNLEGIFNLQIEDVALKTGNTYTVAVSAQQLNSLRGFQGTMSLSGVELLDIEHNVTSDENFGPHPGLPHEGRSYVTMSWNDELAGDAVLFSLVIQAMEDQMLSEALAINDRYTMSEAYETLPQGGDVALRQRGLGVEFTQGWAAGPVFELYQNSPNPFEEVTMISFNLPQANEATITIRDAAGRLIKQINGDYAAGYNTVQLTKRDLQGASGVMSYTVEAGDHRATRQMIVLQ